MDNLKKISIKFFWGVQMNRLIGMVLLLFWFRNNKKIFFNNNHTPLSRGLPYFDLFFYEEPKENQ